MKKDITKNIQIIFFSAVLILALYLGVQLSHQKLNIKQCTALMREENEVLNIKASYERILSVVNNSGYLRETGFIRSKQNTWRFNRYYSFRFSLLQGDSFEIELLSSYKAEDDNVPDDMFKLIRPEQGTSHKLTHIENVAPRVWLFSGVAYPVFSCKEK